MPTSVPPSIPVDGRLRVYWVPAIADMNAPTIAEITAGVDITCYLRDTKVGVSKEQTSIPDRPMCSTTANQVPGSATVTSDDIMYIYDPQAPADDAMNVAADTLVEDESGYMVVRRGVLYDTAMEAGQFVEVRRDTLGVRWDSSTPTEDFSKYTQRLFNAGFVEKAAIAA